MKNLLIGIASVALLTNTQSTVHAMLPYAFNCNNDARFQTAQRMFKLGRDQQAQGNITGANYYYTQGSLSLISLANEGYIDAILDLGRRHMYGDCIEQNYHVAIRYYTCAFRNPHAKYIAAKLHYLLASLDNTENGRQQHLRDAYNLFEQAHRAGFQESADMLSELRSLNDQTHRLDKAIELKDNGTLADLLKLQKAGDPDATYLIGRRYFHGNGATKNLDQAIRCFKKAINQNNHADANYYLGLCYLQTTSPLTFRKDVSPLSHHKLPSETDCETLAQQAEKIFQKEAKQSKSTFRPHSTTTEDLYGISSQHSASVVQLFLNAVSRGCRDALVPLGDCLLHGTNGVVRSPVDALMCYQRAAELGYAEAQRRLGDCCAHGIGTPVNIAAAKHWYQKAAEQKQFYTQPELGDWYVKTEITRYKEEALNGNIDAQIQLRKWGMKYLCLPGAIAELIKYRHDLSITRIERDKNTFQYFQTATKETLSAITYAAHTAAAHAYEMEAFAHEADFFAQPFGAQEYERISAKHYAEEKAKREAEEQARREAEEQARREAEEQAIREAEEQARREAEEQARREDEEKARREDEEKARREAEEKARREAEEQARREAEEQARREAEEQARREDEEKARREAEARQKRDAATKAKLKAEKHKQQLQAVAKQAKKARKAARKAAEKAQREAEEKAKREEAEKAKRELEEAAKKAQEQHQAAMKLAKKNRKAARKAAEKAQREAEEKAKREEAEKAKRELEEKEKRLQNIISCMEALTLDEPSHSEAKSAMSIAYILARADKINNERILELADQLTPQEQFQLGAISFYGEFGLKSDPALWVPLWEKAATHGHTDAAYCLGTNYCQGIFIKGDTLTGIEWLKKAAQHGRIDAKYDSLTYQWDAASTQAEKLKILNTARQLAERDAGYKWFLYQYDTPCDQRSAALTDAINSGCAIAITTQGNSCCLNALHGKNAEHNFHHAAQLFSQAAAKGYPSAIAKLGICHYYGYGVKEDKATAFRYFQEAAFTLQGSGLFRYGLCLMEGTGCIENHKEGLRWIERAAKQGDLNAQYTLGLCLLMGEFCPKNVKAAVQIFDKLTLYGNAEATYRLGECYFNGIGVSERNLTYAKQLLQLAKDRGCKNADALLEKIDKPAKKTQRKKTPAAVVKDAAAHSDENSVEMLRSEASINANQSSELKKSSQDTATSATDTPMTESDQEAAELYASGYRAYLQQDFQTAVKLFTLAAWRNNAKAQYYIGICLMNGYGIPPHTQIALNYITQAAENGDIDAECYLAYFAYHNHAKTEEEKQEIIRSISKAAQDTGSANTYVYLYRLYTNELAKGKRLDPEMLPSDAHTPLELLTKASAQGNEDAQNILGMIIYDHAKTTQDAIVFQKAFELFSQAVSNGCFDAKLFLGLCYHRGHGVKQDYSKALQYLDDGLSMFYIRQNFTDRNPDDEDLLLIACQDAMYNMALNYLNGTNVAKDKKLAVQILTKLSLYGHVNAMCELGEYYSSIKQDLLIAKQWFSLASEYGHRAATVKLLDIEKSQALHKHTPQNAHERYIRFMTYAAPYTITDQYTRLPSTAIRKTLSVLALIDSPVQYSLQSPTNSLPNWIFKHYIPHLSRSYGAHSIEDNI